MKSSKVLALVVAVSLLSCSSRTQNGNLSAEHIGNNNLTPPPNNSSSPIQTSSPISPPQESREDQLKEEALKLGQSFLKKHVIKCDESHYWRVYRPGRGETLSYEARDYLGVDVQGTYYPPKELTKADELNGVDKQPLEWSGYVSMKFETWRPLGGRWVSNRHVSVEVNRYKGKWYVNAATFPGIKTRSPSGAAQPYGIQSAFEPNSPTHDKFVDIECDK
ncbi:MAG TPA: hypothetical protein VJU86_16380 [Pyrinomonadaceae bacterium]|nr:hypothetical protein [Pyrinomonadaceae bacterium]